MNKTPITESTILSRIDEMSAKVIPLVKPMHELYLGFTKFKSNFNDVFISFNSSVNVKIVQNNKLQIDLSDYNEVSIKANRDWMFSLIEYSDKLTQSQFNWDYDQNLSSDSILINSSDSIQVPIAFEKYAVFDLITDTWYHNGMEFDDYSTLEMQMCTVSTTSYYNKNTTESMVNFIKEMKNIIPAGYTFTYDNLYRYITYEDIEIIQKELEIAIKTFSR